MRGAIPTLVLIAAMMFVTYGCSGKSASEPTEPESSSGGEAPTEAGAVPSEALASSEAESPWGATRAEQCRREAHPPMSAKARRAFNQGVRAAATNDNATAETSFQSALKKDPNAYPALYNLGVLADRAGNERDAMNYYQRALRIVPDYEPAARGVSTIQIRRKQVQDAVATVEPLANEYRANLEMQALYAEVLVEARRLDEAWMAARRALKCDERFVPALVALVKASRSQGRDELADSILEQAMQVDPDVAELHFLQGERLEAEPGQLREAMAAYQRAIQLRPNYAEARMALGIQLLAGGNYPAALSHFQAAERLVPTLPEIHVNLGDAYRATKQWPEAQGAYRRALELQSKLPEAHYGLGLLFLTAAGDFPGLDELAAYEKAVKELKTYRAEMGPRLAKDDQAEEYLRDLDRMIKRARRRIEREQGGTS
ncbi:MAG: tetratricopeptide repeat protein [Deltaproteobacteria bacterium]|nr:tetratricopeptide repeat protein [Deltaproteobacteria bacterium]MBW2209714.1 tetratricopeptide repeat protein [Deltaproteobacteria bacterium]MBW2378044.1 tetratricopeptide repeat protein [Deltaproteobacteria bacterium]MBW2549498.1 tetratricopeptide repeat protein [Deltaproteobacteria bacterium]MBW2626932.1 tetratricopeptide repeat protein [Deltaproteobacteria bacterium]